MNNNELISKNKNIHKVVLTFADELNKYIESMESELTVLTNSLKELGAGWSGEDFNKFYEKMQLRIKKIQAELVRAQKVKAELFDTSKVFEEIIKILTKASE